MAQEQVAPGKASLALGTLKGLFLGVGTLVPLQVLKSGEGSCACSADMRARLVGLWGREVGRGRSWSCRSRRCWCFGVDGNGRCFYQRRSSVSYGVSLPSSREGRAGSGQAKFQRMAPRYSTNEQYPSFTGNTESTADGR